MCFEVLGVFLCQLEFVRNEISLKRSGDRVDSGTRLISPLGCGEKIRQSTEVGLMGLRAHTTRPRSPRDASFFCGKNTKHLSPKRDGACISAPAAPSLLSPACHLQHAPDPKTPSINSASSAAISGLTPRHRALTAAPTWGGLSRCLARWPPPAKTKPSSVQSFSAS